MYENKVHSVPDRIVSISQPYIRPIVRGKAAAPVEFGAKLDLSLDEKRMARIERMSFDAYNESDVLISAVERYKARTGHSAKNTASGSPVLRLDDQRKKERPTKNRNTKIMLTGLPLKEHSPLQSTAMDWVLW